MEMFYDVFLVSGCKLKMWPRPMLTRQLSGCRWLFILLSFRGKYGCDMLWTATKFLFWNYSHVNLLYSKFRRDPLLGPLFSWHELYSLSTVSGFPDFHRRGKAAGSGRNGRRRLLDFVELHQWVDVELHVDGGIDVNDEHNSRCTHHFQHFSFLGADVWGWYPFSLKISECLRKKQAPYFCHQWLGRWIYFLLMCFFLLFFGGIGKNNTHTHLHGSFWTKL